MRPRRALDGRRGRGPNSSMGSGLLGSGDLPAAARLLLGSDDLPRRDVIAHSSVLAAFLRAGYPWRALLHLSSSMGRRL